MNKATYSILLLLLGGFIFWFASDVVYDNARYKKLLKFNELFNQGLYVDSVLGVFYEQQRDTVNVYKEQLMIAVGRKDTKAEDSLHVLFSANSQFAMNILLFEMRHDSLMNAKREMIFE